MFEVAAPPALVLSQVHVALGAEKGSYTRYKPATHVACHECVGWLYEHGGAGPYPCSARWVRRVAGVKREVPGFDPVVEGGSMLPLCDEHTELWKARDLEKFKGKP
jgi:hypothetical protein